MRCKLLSMGSGDQKKGNAGKHISAEMGYDVGPGERVGQGNQKVESSQKNSDMPTCARQPEALGCGR